MQSIGVSRWGKATVRKVGRMRVWVLVVNEIFELQVWKSLNFYNVLTPRRAARPAWGVWGACAASPPRTRKKFKKYIYNWVRIYNWDEYVSESVLTVNGFFLLWRMKHERGMSEVMHLELIVNSIYIHILTVNIFRYRIVVSETSQWVSIYIWDEWVSEWVCI